MKSLNLVGHSVEFLPIEGFKLTKSSYPLYKLYKYECASFSYVFFDYTHHIQLFKIVNGRFVDISEIDLEKLQSKLNQRFVMSCLN